MSLVGEAAALIDQGLPPTHQLLILKQLEPGGYHRLIDLCVNLCSSIGVPAHVCLPLLFLQEILKVVILDPRHLFDLIRVGSKACINILACEYNVVKFMLGKAIARFRIVQDTAHHTHIVGFQIFYSKFKISSPHSRSSHSDVMRFWFQLLWNMSVV